MPATESAGRRVTPPRWGRPVRRGAGASAGVRLRSRKPGEAPAHALWLASPRVPRQEHVAGPVARAEEGCSRPALAVEDRKESPALGQPGEREPRAMRVLPVRAPTGPKRLPHPRAAAERIAGRPGGTEARPVGSPAPRLLLCPLLLSRWPGQTLRRRARAAILFRLGIRKASPSAPAPPPTALIPSTVRF